MNAATELESKAEPLREAVRKEEQPEHSHGCNLQQQPAVSPTTPWQCQQEDNSATSEQQQQQQRQAVQVQVPVQAQVVKESKEQEQGPPELQLQSQAGPLGKEETKQLEASNDSSLQPQPAVSPTTPGQCEQEENNATSKQQQPLESQLNATIDEDSGKERSRQPQQPQTELQSEASLCSEQEQRRQHEQAPELEGRKTTTASTAAQPAAASQKPAEPLPLAKEETKQLEASLQQPAVGLTTGQCEQEA